MGDYFEQSISVPLETFESYTLLKTTRNLVWPIKPSTLKNYVCSTIKYSFGISLKKSVSAMCFDTTLLDFTMTLLN